MPPVRGHVPRAGQQADRLEATRRPPGEETERRSVRRNAPTTKPVLTLEVTTTAFGHGQRIPELHLRDGKNRSPMLSWKTFPDNTRSFVVLCEDPDAPREEAFVHWVLYAVPAWTNGLPRTMIPEGLSKEEEPSEIPGARHGSNDFDEIGYDGPAPPRGHGTHHYRFRVYALDDDGDHLPPGLNKRELLRMMRDHILAFGEVVGTARRDLEE